jgi:cyclopropane-fatty-acyl-phospholipid synthase
MESLVIDLAERRWLPDWLVRAGIRRLLAERLRQEYQRYGHGQDETRLADDLSQAPIVVHADEANEQHYEVPAAFFQKVLGRQLKYSCGYWPRNEMSLDDAEAEMLELTTWRAGIEDGMRILELGCGWGSLSLWMAERFPRARITAISNSHGQRTFIENRCQQRGLTNLQVITTNIADFETSKRFDRIVSVEMFEHVRNHQRLFDRIAKWLTPEGRLFVHVFCHRELTYLFEAEGESNWMGRHFFTGGMMPSLHWLSRFRERLHLEQSWVVGGQHYQQTAEAWLARLDHQQRQITDLFRRQLSPQDTQRQIARWRLFFMACAELFGYREGSEWFVAHYRFAPQSLEKMAEQRDTCSTEL